MQSVNMNLLSPFYRIDGLCRDVLLFRDALPVPQYDQVFQCIISARQLLEAEDLSTDGPALLNVVQPDAIPGRGEGGIGRPKFNISEEQLQFFAGNS